MMKIKSLFLILAFSFSVHAIENGLEYKSSNIEGVPTKILTLDTNKLKLVAVRTQDIGTGLHTVQDMAEKFSALAAINGGYFRFKDKNSIDMLPAGILKIANNWHGIAYKPRGALGWDPNRNLFLIDIVQTQSFVKIADQMLPINAINLANSNKSVLFSDSFKIYENKQNNLNVFIVDNKVVGISNSNDINIPANGYIYQPGNKYFKHLVKVKSGDEAQVDIKVQAIIKPDLDIEWNQLPYIVGGGPVLISGGNIVSDYSVEKLAAEFINSDNTRTAVGILNENKLILVVTDKTSIPKLAKIMHKLGCVAALNLDGGGSSDMYVAGISDAFSRTVADAILVLARD